MKRLIFTILMLSCVQLMAADKGFEVVYHQPDALSMELLFTTGEIQLDEVVYDGVTYEQLVTDFRLHTEQAGWAEIPFATTALQLGNTQSYDLKVTPGSYTDYQLTYPMLPSRGVIYRDQDPSTIPYVIDPQSITDRFYPTEHAEITSPYIIKDVRGATVTVYPVRYNAARNILRVYHTMTVQLIENDAPAVNPLTVQNDIPLREMIGIYESAFINYTSPVTDLTIADNGEILIYCTARDEAAIQPYIDWKRQKGLVVHKEVVATGTDVNNLVQAKYDANNNILYVLLVGDWADIKCANSNGTPKDPVTGCVVGNDNYFDICVGRLAANSAAAVTTQVNKIITYEKEPDVGANWYKKATGVASSQGTGDDGEYDYQHIQIIYDDKLSQFTYNVHNAIYDPTANPTMVTAALQTGTSVINYCGHGSTTSWGSSGYSNSHIASLTNGTKLPIIFSVACVNGSYHNAYCFAEAWMNQQGGGAVGTVMATINQPWNPPMRGQDYFNDLIIGGYDYSLHPGQNGISTTEGRHTFGSIVFNGLVLMITESPGDLETAQTWILFGDPSMQIRTDTPATLAYNNNVMLVGTPFETTITKNGTPLAGAQVALSQNGITLSAISNAIGFVSIPNNFLSGDVQLVATAFNCTTIDEIIQCIPPTGPYVIYNNHAINDVNGNNNGQLDYGESVTLDMTMKNVGVAAANNVNVTMTTTDAYITIIDGSATFGNIGPGATKTVSNAFAIQAANDIPDGHAASLKLSATNGTDVWESNVSIQAHAPVLKYAGYAINDPNGNNNGMLDPGETATMVLTIENSGSSDAFNVNAQLLSTDPYVSVLTTTPQQIGDLSFGSTGTASFMVHAAANTPFGHTAVLNINMTANMGISQQDDLSIVFTDYCEASTNYEDEYISKVVCGDINNSSGWQNAVANYTDITTTLEPGVPVPITVTNGNAWSSDKVTVWIDWSLDKELGSNSNETFVLTSNSGGATFTGNIVAPAGQQSGQYRMRVRMTYSSSPVPCGNSNYGEVEDYTVLIGQPMNLPPPENLTAQVSADDVTLTWTAPERLTLTGYNIYRDGVMIDQMVTQTTWIDANCPEGSYWYAVTALYTEGESGHCNPVQVKIGGFIGKVQGTVRDATTNLSIPNAWVSALNTDFGAVTYATPFGSHYTLSLPGGNYQLVCNAPDYQQSSIYNVVLVDGGTTTVNFYLYPATEEYGSPTTGTSNPENRSISIWPNPAGNILNLEITGGSNIEIVSPSGVKMLSKSNCSQQERIDVRQLPAGVYFVKITAGENVSIHKVMIR
ncbi:MAG: T9SS type A sorting domain-containing protein [Bacteroidales bacterium]|nr:T9SS type A sorting domain-containing protein [Bacteroidales bacterium]